jgi:hypothetical protein
LKGKCHAQHSQDNRDNMVKKLEKGAIVACTKPLQKNIKLSKKDMSKHQDKKSKAHDKCLNHVSTCSTQGNCRCFETGGVPKPTSECAACPSPDGSSAWASAKGGKERGGRRPARERDGNPAAFVFVPRPGRVRLQ